MRDVQIGSAYKAALAGASGSQNNSVDGRAPLGRRGETSLPRSSSRRG